MPGYLVTMTTDLARAWEKDEAIRTKGRKLEAVPWFIYVVRVLLRNICH